MCFVTSASKVSQPLHHTHNHALRLPRAVAIRITRVVTNEVVKTSRVVGQWQLAVAVTKGVKVAVSPFAVMVDREREEQAQWEGSAEGAKRRRSRNWIVPNTGRAAASVTEPVTVAVTVTAPLAPIIIRTADSRHLAASRTPWPSCMTLLKSP